MPEKPERSLSATEQGNCCAAIGEKELRMCRLAQARRSQKAVVSNFLRNLAPDFSQYSCERPEMTLTTRNQGTPKKANYEYGSTVNGGLVHTTMVFAHPENEKQDSPWTKAQIAVLKVVAAARKARVMRRAWIAVSCVVLLTFFVDSCAQIPVLIGNNIDLSSGLTVQRGGPSAAYNSANNEYMVVWFDLRNKPTTGNDVYGQRLSANGSLLGGNIPIATEIGSQSGAFVAYNSIDNNYLVAWESQFDGPGSPDFNDAFGRLVSNVGIPLGGAFHISDAGHEISSAYNPANNHFLVTGRVFQSGPVPGIFGQIVSNAGSLVGGGIVISTVGTAGPNGQVIYNPTINEYFATWREGDDLNGSVRGQRISATGVLIGNPI